MDVGSDNFRFTLGDPEKKSRAIRQPQCVELHVSSLDRFNSTPGISQTIAQLSYDLSTNPINASSSQCTINTQRSLLYGYFNRIALTEFQLLLRVPTIIAGVNDTFILRNNPGGVGTPVSYLVTIPQGYYTTTLLAIAMTTAIKAAVSNLTNAALFTVTGPTITSTVPVSGTIQTGFILTTGTTDTIVFMAPALSLTTALQYSIWKFYRLIGTNALGFTGWPGNIPTPVLGTTVPNWLPTDYVDIVSKALTNYKDNAKDTNSSEAAPQGVIGRIYLTDSYQSIVTATGYCDPNCIGAAPVLFTKKWISPNWSQWSPDQSLTSIDITLLDMWGQPIYYNNSTLTAGSSEWEMTITASE